MQSIVCRGALIAASFMLAAAATAQPAWKPERAVEIIIGTAPGNSPDRLGRTLQSLWTEKRLVETPVQVVNRPGAGNVIAWQYLSTRAGDPHYLMVATLSLSTGYLTGRSRFGYRDFTPLAILYDEYVAITVRADSPIRDGRDLIERLRKDPGSLSLGQSSALGSANHLAAGLVLKAAGVDVRKVRTVVFDSAGPVITAALGGHVDFVATSVSVPVPQMQAGGVRVLGVVAPRRLGGVYANVPTWRELGVDAVLSSYRGMIGAKDMTDAQIAFWEDRLATATREPSWRAEAEKNHLDATFVRSREMRKYLDDLESGIKSLLDDLGLLKR